MFSNLPTETNRQPQRTKKQHTVPRFYLEHFSRDGRGIYVFDKLQRRAFPQALTEAGQEKLFYDLSTELLPPEAKGDVQWAEKMLGRVMEGKFSLFFAELANDMAISGISKEGRSSLAFYMAIQILRTRRFRNSLAEIYDKYYEHLEPNEERRQQQRETGQSAAAQVGLMLNQDIVTGIREILCGHLWFFGINNTDVPLVTSDEPIARYYHGSALRGGIASLGVELVFPLSPKHLIILQERSYFADRIKYDGSRIELSPLGVDSYNSLQTAHCHRHVFSPVNDFAFALSLCNKYPELSKRDIEYVQVLRSESGIGLSVWF